MARSVDGWSPFPDDRESRKIRERFFAGKFRDNPPRGDSNGSRLERRKQSRRRYSTRIGLENFFDPRFRLGVVRLCSLFTVKAREPTTKVSRREYLRVTISLSAWISFGETVITEEIRSEGRTRNILREETVVGPNATVAGTTRCFRSGTGLVQSYSLVARDESPLKVIGRATVTASLGVPRILSRRTVLVAARERALDAIASA